jgi:hypothetical protein
MNDLHYFVDEDNDFFLQAISGLCELSDSAY